MTDNPADNQDSPAAPRPRLVRGAEPPLVRLPAHDDDGAARPAPHVQRSHAHGVPLREPSAWLHRPGGVAGACAKSARAIKARDTGWQMQ